MSNQNKNNQQPLNEHVARPFRGILDAWIKRRGDHVDEIVAPVEPPDEEVAEMAKYTGDEYVR